MKWLLQEGNLAKKHEEWTHSIAVYLIHYCVVIITAFCAHDILVPSRDECMNDTSPEYILYLYRQQNCAIFAGVYAILQQTSRVWTTTPFRNCVLYENTWLCNTTLAVGALALWFQRPIIAAAFCVTVGIDQLLWYVDIASWAFTGRFPIGVAKYLTWPETPWATRLTCTHHLWTIPLFIYYAAAPLQVEALLLSCLLMVVHVTLSRLMTPFRVGNVDKGKYLNVNLSHELWKDIKMSALQISTDNPPAHVYLFRLLVRWQGFNLLVYLVLLLAVRLIFGNDVPQRLC